ncbi:acyl-coenzyme A thioesterase 5-like [Pseudoliparis swirei]|uniref:acyl-coenzyme A thioesterase 5-like n=1 Tax=Pseudoliparis swirei TaxID=2059687 RepID=UPI0024BEA1EA|nr:acyl-coenzyme A thioesterase 5-like [Pseudoliparis swirei]
MFCSFFVSEKMSSQIRLRLLPRARCLFDEPVQVKVDGLRSSQMVTVRARATDERGVAFSSSATYRADGGGVVDLERDPSLGGTYTGIEPTGLLWSMKPATPHKRFQRTNAMNPHVVKFSVEEQEEGGRVLAEATNERLLIGDGVSRKTIKDGNIRGVLFTPPGEGPFPAVLDLYTFGGGLSERRASLLASRGFLVLTVALYGHEDMPKAIQVVHLDYFEEAIRLLKKQNGVGSNDIGVISMSKSADLALSIASFLSGVAATVWINGCCSNVMLPLHFRGKQLLPGLRLDVDKLIPPKDESGAADGRKVLRDPLAEENQAALVPVERAECVFLFAAAATDHNWDSGEHGGGGGAAPTEGEL